MKHFYTVLFSVLILASCKQSPTENTMALSGQIKGLKKGVLYLQHVPDSTLVVIDSVLINGNGNFSFKTELESPEVFYLYLVKEDNNDINDRITFFGEPGNISINTQWDSFDLYPDIKGSISHEKFVEYRSMMSKFNIQDISLLEQAFKANSSNNQQLFDSIQILSERNTLRSYLFALNFAMINSDSYVAPYVAITDVSNANVKFLDSIYKKLSPEVAISKYGKSLKKLIISSKK
ncbi:MAG: DUF4369 domain-containing protein [Flavobacteriaceae bacterium]|tara:strand:+ start:1703 stop:2407 length:705 start_codon:yes stop_codon:yes gene_type:complete